MPWFCDEIIAQPSQGLFDYLRLEKRLAKRLYLVRDISLEKHDFPAEGLLFVRNIGNPEAPDIEISWDDVPERVATSLIIDPSMPKVYSTDEDNCSPSPPAKFLRFLKSLAQEFDSIVAYYSAFSGGGPLEWEYAWVFTPNEIVYCNIDLYQPRIGIYREDGSVSEQEGDVLVKVLLHLGIDSPTGYFVPHASPFEWRTFKVKRRA